MSAGGRGGGVGVKRWKRIRGSTCFARLPCAEVSRGRFGLLPRVRAPLLFVCPLCVFGFVAIISASDHRQLSLEHGDNIN